MNNRVRMSPSAVFVSGVFCAVLLLAVVLVLRQIDMMYSPTLKNSERLLDKGRAREAKALLDKAKAQGRARGDSKALLLRGKVLFAVLLEQLREEKWGSYGTNPNNWLSHPLADEAEKCFLDAVAAAPNDPEARRILGNLYREQGRFGDAENMLRSALELDEKNAETFLALGLLYAEGNRPAAAWRALLAAWELDEGNPKIARNIAFFYRFYIDAPESSIVWFNRYLDNSPRRDPDAILARAELRDLLERYPEFGEFRHEPRNAGRWAQRKGGSVRYGSGD